MIQPGDHVCVALAQEVRVAPRHKPTWYHAVVLELRTATGKTIDGLNLEAFPAKCRRVRVWAKIAFHADPKGRLLHIERSRCAPSEGWDAVRMPTPDEYELFRRDQEQRDSLMLLRTLALKLPLARAAEILGLTEEAFLVAEQGRGVLNWERAKEMLRRGAKVPP